jgi:hypothetical protein
MDEFWDRSPLPKLRLAAAFTNALVAINGLLPAAGLQPEIEPMTCAPNAFQRGEGLVTLDADESFAAGWGLESL